MAFPDTSIGNQFPTLGEEQTTITMHARIDTPLDAVAARVVDSGWTTAALSNSWVSYDAAAVFSLPAYRLKAGIAWLAGEMKSGTLNTTVMTLPAGMRPLKQISFTVSSAAGTAIIYVLPTGVVQVIGYTTGGSNASVSLNGIQFIAEQ